MMRDFLKPEHQNSAGRLLAILKAIPDGKRLIDVIPELQGVKTNASHEKQQIVLVFLMEVHEVYLEFLQDMLNAKIKDTQRDALLSGLQSLQETLYPIQLNNPLRKPTEAEISLLQVCATFIDEESPITDDDIEAIRKSISELRGLVESGTISPTLKKTPS